MPVVQRIIPGLDEVREFAAKMHAAGRAWQGEAFGWPAEYSPEEAEPPLDSKMTFTPADFCIGESGIWFFSLCGSTVVTPGPWRFSMIGTSSRHEV